nr:hypothetical protein 22 [Pelagibacteraceae bacterium]
MTQEIAWAAGVFEGEGTIYILKCRPSCANLQISMCDLDILERIQNLFGGNIYQKKKQKPHHKPIWTWQLSKSKDIVNTLTKLIPWFGHRRAYKALNTLDHLDRI